MFEFIIFDLDDTLYPEIEFVKSGFQAVASFLGSLFRTGQEQLYLQMLKILNHEGRGRIFDGVIEQYQPEEISKIVPQAVYIYRTHRPQHLEPFSDAKIILKDLSGMVPMAILTDGIPITQKNKIGALRIAHYFDQILISDELGQEFRKPSFIPFLHIVSQLDLSPKNGCYVGDNINKDFKGAKEAGLQTFWINREALNATPDHEAIRKGLIYVDSQINSLIELLDD